jgi:hypothetical protein
MDDRDGRGQLLLVAALGLAVAFVVLAVVLNAVVFTENLATQNHGRTDDVVAFQTTVEDDVGGLVTAVNEHNNSDYQALHDTLLAGVAKWDADTALLSASDGRVTNATVIDVENGTRVVQSETRAFTNNSSVADWTLATDVEETRRFHVVVSQNNSSNPFRVRVSDGAATWTVRIEDNGSSTDVFVLDDGVQRVKHTEAAETVDIDLTRGAVNDTIYANWTFAEGVGHPYNISYENGDTASGEYEFVVDRPRADLLNDLPADHYASRSSGDYPTTIPAIYRANVSVTVLRSSLTYETVVEVEPGAPDAEN